MEIADLFPLFSPSFLLKLLLLRLINYNQLLPSAFRYASKYVSLKNKKKKIQGTWVAQSVKHPAIDVSSGPGLTVRGFKPRIRLCADSLEPASNSVSPSLSLYPYPIHALSLSLSK